MSLLLGLIPWLRGFTLSLMIFTTNPNDIIYQNENPSDLLLYDNGEISWFDLNSDLVAILKESEAVYERFQSIPLTSPIICFDQFVTYLELIILYYAIASIKDVYCACRTIFYAHTSVLLVFIEVCLLIILLRNLLNRERASHLAIAHKKKKDDDEDADGKVNLEIKATGDQLLGTGATNSFNQSEINIRHPQTSNQLRSILRKRTDSTPPCYIPRVKFDSEEDDNEMAWSEIKFLSDKVLSQNADSNNKRKRLDNNSAEEKNINSAPPTKTPLIPSNTSLQVLKTVDELQSKCMPVHNSPKELQPFRGLSGATSMFSSTPSSQHALAGSFTLPSLPLVATRGRHLLKLPQFLVHRRTIPVETWPAPHCSSSSDSGHNKPAHGPLVLSNKVKLCSGEKFTNEKQIGGTKPMVGKVKKNIPITAFKFRKPTPYRTNLMKDDKYLSKVTDHQSNIVAKTSRIPRLKSPDWLTLKQMSGDTSGEINDYCITTAVSFPCPLASKVFKVTPTSAKLPVATQVVRDINEVPHATQQTGIDTEGTRWINKKESGVVGDSKKCRISAPTIKNATSSTTEINEKNSDIPEPGNKPGTVLQEVDPVRSQRVKSMVVSSVYSYFHSRKTYPRRSKDAEVVPICKINEAQFDSQISSPIPLPLPSSISPIRRSRGCQEPAVGRIDHDTAKPNQSVTETIRKRATRLPLSCSKGSLGSDDAAAVSRQASPSRLPRLIHSLRDLAARGLVQGIGEAGEMTGHDDGWEGVNSTRFKAVRLSKTRSASADDIRPSKLPRPLVFTQRREGGDAQSWQMVGEVPCLRMSPMQVLRLRDRGSIITSTGVSRSNNNGSCNGTVNINRSNRRIDIEKRCNA